MTPDAPLTAQDGCSPRKTVRDSLCVIMRRGRSRRRNRRCRGADAGRNVIDPKGCSSFDALPTARASRSAAKIVNVNLRPDDVVRYPASDDTKFNVPVLATTDAGKSRSYLGPISALYHPTPNDRQKMLQSRCVHWPIASCPMRMCANPARHRPALLLRPCLRPLPSDWWKTASYRASCVANPRFGGWR